MIQRIRRRRVLTRVAIAATGLLLTGGPLFAQPATQPTDDTLTTGDQSLDFALAERFALWGDDAAAIPNTPDPILREAAAALDLARAYKPREVRFARSSADVLLRLGERDRALAALSALRSLDPRDQLAMIQFVDLTADRMETAEAKATYLKQVADANGVAAEVRSHAATLLMNLCFERSQDAQGLEAMSQALSLNPQNLAALQVRYQVAATSGDPAERAKALAAILQAAPNNPSNLVGMAQECAAAGDYENASVYYEFGLNVIARSGQAPPMDDFIDLIGVQMLAGQTAALEAMLGDATAHRGNESRLFALHLMVQMVNGKSDVDLASQINAARGVYLAQLALASQMLNQPENRTPPATNPAVPMPNVAADVARLTTANGDPNNLRGQYTVALAELIWFDAYFRAAPVDPQLIESLRTLVGDPNDPLVVRLEGWALLAANRVDEAVVKLSAVADRDGYAKLGLAAAATAKHEDDKAKQILTELLTNRPTGLYAATVALAAKKAGVAPPDMTPAERQIAGLAGSLKNPIANLLNNPRGSYLLSARPLTISVAYGEPLLAEVRILNTGSFPLTIGPGGLIQPKFTVDLTTRGAASRVFPASVVGSWTGPVRLPPQQGLVQIVRVDRGPFGDFLRQYPTVQFAVNGMVTIDPMIVERGSFPSPGGQQATIGDGMERKASPLHVEAYRTQLIQRLAQGSAVERLNAAELAASVVPLLQQQAGNADAQRVAQQLADAVASRASAEPMAEVRGLISLAAATAAPDAASRLPATLDQLAASDSPVAQAAAMWTARALPAVQRKAIAQRVLSKQPRGAILEMANGLAAQDDLPPPPAPSTQPATQPAS